MAIQKHEVIKVTPELAEEWLKNQHKMQIPRHTDAYVAQYARDMENGNWSDDVASPIVFAANGKLLDGQHRLEAIVKTGMSFYMLVVTVEHESSYKFIDIGHSRQAYQLVAVPSAVRACSIARRIVGMENGRTLRKSIEGTAGVTTIETVNYVEDNASYITSLVKAAVRCRTYIHQGPVSSYGAVLHVCENVYGAGSSEKIELRLRDGSEMTKDFVRRINGLYSGRVSPRACVPAFHFADYCKHVMEDDAYEFQKMRDFGKGLSVLKDWESEYEIGKKMEDMPAPSK